jgi:hypothetical protein
VAMVKMTTYLVVMNQIRMANLVCHSNKKDLHYYLHEAK